MRKLKKLIALTMCAAVMMSSSVYAETIDITHNYNPGDSVYTQTVDPKPLEIEDDFSDAWELKIQVKFVPDKDAPIWMKATIGFDTWWTDEDYVKNAGGVCSGFDCHSRIINSDGDSDWTGWIKANKTSGKKDIKHTGKNVTYRFRLKSASN